jgi:Ser/Thr protein kinase RdoA (MazF antagonist)
MLDGLARAALALYALPEIRSLTLVNQSENATYKAELADGRAFALRLHRQGYHSDAAIQSELVWLSALRKESIALTPRPLQGRDGALLQTANHDGMQRRAVLFEWENGKQPGIADQLKEPFKTLGMLAARMHLHSRQWQKPDGFERFTWDAETALGDVNPHWGSWRHGLGMTHHLSHLFARTVAAVSLRLAAYGKTPDRFGLIHADLRLANLLIDGSTVKVLDFDDCGYSWFMYDAAVTMSFHEHEPVVPDLIAAWKDGYRTVTQLSAEDEATIPALLMLRRLLLVAWLGSHSETRLAKQLGPNYTEQSADLCEQYLSEST